MSITRPKWTYRPGIYRCDRGWDDSTGTSIGCRRSGVRQICAEWLCGYHALVETRLLNRFQFTCSLCLRRNATRCPGAWCSSCNMVNGKLETGSDLRLHCDVNRCPGTVSAQAQQERR